MRERIKGKGRSGHILSAIDAILDNKDKQGFEEARRNPRPQQDIRPAWMPHFTVGMLNSLTFEMPLPPWMTLTQIFAVPAFRRLSALTRAV